MAYAPAHQDNLVYVCTEQDEDQGQKDWFSIKKLNKIV